jgi:hypothetical protein
LASSRLSATPAGAVGWRAIPGPRALLRPCGRQTGEGAPISAYREDSGL